MASWRDEHPTETRRGTRRAFVEKRRSYLGARCAVRFVPPHSHLASLESEGEGWGAFFPVSPRRLLYAVAVWL
jgi:hypothetical protein